MAEDPLMSQTFATRKAAENVSKLLGCTGAHQMGDNWHPCEDHESLITLVDEGIDAYRALQARKRGEENRQGDSKRVIASHELIEQEKARPKRKRRKRWEKLGERGRPVNSIYTSSPNV